MAGKQFRLFSETEQPSKICSRCHTRKPTDEFTLRYIGPRGRHYRSKCKPCDRAYGLEWCADNRDSLNARKRELYKQNENYKTHARGWYQRNKTYFVEYRAKPKNRQRERDVVQKRIASESPGQKETRRLAQKQSRARRPETMRTYRQRTKEHATRIRKAWNEKHPHARAEYSMQRRVRKRGIPFECINRAAIVERDKSTCYLCGKILNQTEIHLEHVMPLARGGLHTAANLRVACAPCNYAKWQYTLEEYLALRDGQPHAIQ